MDVLQESGLSSRFEEHAVSSLMASAAAHMHQPWPIVKIKGI